MKLHLLDRSSTKNVSITVKRNRYPCFLKIWHYHPELELVLSKKSTGTRFVGDSIKSFNEGDIVLVGENLPHMWLNDDVYFEESSGLIAEAITIHFRRNFLGANFLEAPEMKHIGELLDRAKYGIKFLDIKDNTKIEIEELVGKEGFDQMTKFIEILDVLAIHPTYELLASEGYLNSVHEMENKNLDKVYAFIFNNFNKPINLQTVANVTHMNPSSFSRFFKRINRKPFSRYLNEIRIGYACKLLMEHKHTITAICYDSGFNNISNFNRQFRSIMKMSPTEYLNAHKSK